MVLPHRSPIDRSPVLRAPHPDAVLSTELRERISSCSLLTCNQNTVGFLSYEGMMDVLDIGHGFVDSWASPGPTIWACLSINKHSESAFELTVVVTDEDEEHWSNYRTLTDSYHHWSPFRHWSIHHYSPGTISQAACYPSNSLWVKSIFFLFWTEGCCIRP